MNTYWVLLVLSDEGGYGDDYGIYGRMEGFGAVQADSCMAAVSIAIFDTNMPDAEPEQEQDRQKWMANLPLPFRNTSRYKDQNGAIYQVFTTEKLYHEAIIRLAEGGKL